jgi:hypothetical protein
MANKPHVWCSSFGAANDFWRADPSDGAPDWTQEGLTLVQAVKYARAGDRRGLSLVDPLLDSHDAFVIECVDMFVGSCATEPELVEIIAKFHREVHVEPNWFPQSRLAEILYHSKYLWAVPIMLRLHHLMWECGGVREADYPKMWIRDLLVGRGEQLPMSPEHFASHAEGGWAIEAWFILKEWRRVVERVGSVHTPIMYGQTFDVRSYADAQRMPPDRSPYKSANRRVYESVTGANCSSWYLLDDGGFYRQQPLQINGEIDRFFAEDTHRYEPGKRYFLGQEVPQNDDPRVIDLMNEAIAFFEDKLREIDRKHLISAGIVEDDEDDDDDDPGFDHYAYTGIDSWPANPNGSAWDRVSHVAQLAALGDFHRLVDQVIYAAELEDDRNFDLFAIDVLADAGPSQQLRRLVTLADERPEARWQELCCLALAGSGLGWALEAAGDLACRIDKDTARYGLPWMRMWRRVMPKTEMDMEVLKLALARDRVGLGARIREHTGRHDPELVLWEGTPLRLPWLGAQLELMLDSDPPAPGWVAVLRHLLQTMTGVDLSMLWADPQTVSPAGVRRGLAALRADVNYMNHEPGSRLFFGTLVPPS